ncbi:hypothetical protein [Halorientalis halophila]|uniref:hypothetical protein n=1 Tax=Halorientalis halophila TaxID=3108499 RepID=UPI003007FE78
MRGSPDVSRSIAGTYLALSGGTLVAALTGFAGVADPWPPFALTGVVAGALGYALSGRIDPERIATSTPLSVSLILPPLASLVWLIALLAHNPGIGLQTLFVRPATLGVLAVGPAMALVEMGTHRTTIARIERSTVLLRFEARPSQRERRLTYGALAVGLGAVAGLLAVLVVLDRGSIAAVLGSVMLGALSFAALRTDRQRVVLTDAGVAVDGTFIEWDEVASYDLDADRLVVRPDGLLRDGYRFDLGGGPDREAVRDALERAGV